MRAFYKKGIVLISIFLVSIINLIAQAGGPNPITTEKPVRTGVITGIVTEKKSDTPMEYSSVAVYNINDSSLVTGTVTNQKGEFVIPDIPFGRYYLVVNFVGYEKRTISPVLVNSENKNAKLGTLQMSVNTNAIEEVEILADQRRVEYKIDKKVVNVSEDLNAAGGTAVDVLENTPSVSVDIEGNVSLRGSSNFTVLIDGKPTVLDGADALRQIPASNIQNIEIITNPSVKYDPDGNGGIINIVLKKQLQKGTSGIVNASVGVNNKYQVDALINKRFGKLNYFVGGGWNDNVYEGSLYREQITYNDDGSDSYNVANGNFDFLRGGTQLRTGIDYDFTPKSNLTFELSGGSYKFGIDRSNNSHEYTIPETEDAYYVNNDLMTRDRIYYSGNLNYTQTFDSSAHKLVVMANYSRRTGGGTEESEYHEADETFTILPYEDPSRTRNVEEGIDNEYRFQLDYSRPTYGGMLEAGYQARIDNNDEDFSYEEYDPDTDSWGVIGKNSSAIFFNRNIQGAYIQYGGNFNKLQYQIGLRGEYTYRLIEYDNFNTSYEINRFDYYPTLHLSRQFENDHQVMASYSKRVDRPRGYYLDSIPSFIDKQTVRIGNPALLPEYINSFELGYQKGWGKNFLAFETYYRNTTNLISRVTDYNEEEGIFYQRVVNLNEDHVIGSEVMLNWQFAKWFKANTSTNVYYYRLLGELNGEAIDNSNFSWRANANVTFSFTPTTRLQVNSGYFGPSVTAQGTSEGMYYVNVAARQDLFKRKLSVTLQVKNLTGSMKREFTAIGDNFSQYVLMEREPRILMLSLSYKINNYRSKPDEMRGEGGGVDMDSGF